MSNPVYFYVEEAAEIARVPVSTIRHYLLTGVLSRKGIGRRVLISRDQLLDLIERKASK